MPRNALYFDELTLYHNLYFNIHCVILSATYSVAWDQAPHCEKKAKKSAWAKKKKKSESEESRKVVWEGERVAAALSPSPALLGRYFFCLTPFFAFLPH